MKLKTVFTLMSYCIFSLNTYAFNNQVFDYSEKVLFEKCPNAISNSILSITAYSTEYISYDEIIHFIRISGSDIGGSIDFELEITLEENLLNHTGSDTLKLLIFKDVEGSCK